MRRRRLAAAALVALTAALVRVAHFAPGLLKGDVYVVYVDGRLQLKGVPFKTVSDYLKVKPGKFKVGERLELLDISDAATAVSAVGGGRHRRRRDQPRPQRRRAAVRPAAADRRRPGRGRGVRRPAAAVDRVGPFGMP